jgi:hypothetical protein
LYKAPTVKERCLKVPAETLKEFGGFYDSRSNGIKTEWIPKDSESETRKQSGLKEHWRNMLSSFEVREL